MNSIPNSIVNPLIPRLYPSMATALNASSLSSSVGVFTISASVLINASRERVWHVILAFPKYPEWRVAFTSVSTADLEFVLL
jgi:hypothetical protein